MATLLNPLLAGMERVRRERNESWIERYGIHQCYHVLVEAALEDVLPTRNRVSAADRAHSLGNECIERGYGACFASDVQSVILPQARLVIHTADLLQPRWLVR